MAQHIAVERIQRRIVEVGRQHTLAEIVQDHYTSDSRQPAKGLFMQFGPDPRTGMRHQQTNRLAAVAQRHPREKAIAALVVLREKVIRPMLASAQEIRPSRGSQNPTALDRHYETVRAGMAGIFRELGVAA